MDSVSYSEKEGKFKCESKGNNRDVGLVALTWGGGGWSGQIQSGGRKGSWRREMR